MILVAPHALLASHFRTQEAFTDENGQAQTRTARVGTGRKLADGTVLSEVITSFGEPLMEPDGVAGRRIAFSHNWSDEEITWIEDVLLATLDDPGPRNTVSLVSELPADWRYPDPV